MLILKSMGIYPTNSLFKLKNTFDIRKFFDEIGLLHFEMVEENQFELYYIKEDNEKQN